MWRNVKPSHLGIGLIVLGFVFMVFAWNGAAKVGCIDCQIPYLISGGFAGLALVVVGGGLLLFESSRRQQAHLEAKLDEVVEALRENGTSTKSVANVPSVQTARANGMVVVGRSSFHRPDCRLVEGKEELSFATPEDAKMRGLSPCRVCEPTKQRAAGRRQ